LSQAIDGIKKESSDCFTESYEKVSDNKVLTLSPNEVSRIIIEGSHSFAFDLIKALHKFEAKDNSSGLLVSPSSIWSALLITYMGAKGETETELKNRLRLQNIPKLSVGMAYQGLRLWTDLKRNMSKISESSSEKTTLSQANKIFLSNRFRLNECLSEFFNADIQQMDFNSKPIQSLEQINEWVKEQTRGKIVDLIPSGAINPWTKMIIANAVYFKSKWLNQFNKENTKKATFHVSPTHEIQVDMMSIETTLMFGISEKLQATAIELPYANPDYSMIIILPHISRGLGSMIRSIKPSDLYELVSNMYDDEVNVVLPKFKVDQQFELAGPLYSMGVKQLFDPRFADLSGFFDKNTTVNGIALNSVVHKSHITVNEEGTEAAAATAMIYGRSGRPVFPTQFVANRPFLYLIRDVATNFILFLGTVRKPLQ
jgi:serpin B